MSSDDRKDPVADKDDLQRAVEERVAAAEAAAGTEPVINAPAKKATRTAPRRRRRPRRRHRAAKKAPPQEGRAGEEGGRQAGARRQARHRQRRAGGRGDHRRAAEHRLDRTRGRPHHRAPGGRAGADRRARRPDRRPGGAARAPDPDPAEPMTPQAPATGRRAAGGPATTGAVQPERGRRGRPAGDRRGLVARPAPRPRRARGRRGWVVRTLRPDAVSVAVVDEDGTRYDARQVHAGGIHEAALPQQPGDYRIEVEYPDGQGGTTRLHRRRPLPLAAHPRPARRAPHPRGPARAAVGGARRARAALRHPARHRRRRLLRRLGARRPGRQGHRRLRLLAGARLPDALPGLLRRLGDLRARRPGGQPVPVPRARCRRRVAGEVRPAGLRHRGAAAERLRRHRDHPRVERRRLARRPRAAAAGTSARSASTRCTRLVAAGAVLPRDGRRAGRLRRRGRLHPHRVHAGGRAPVRRLVGLPGHLVLRAHVALRQPRRLPLPRRPRPPGRHRRHRRLGARRTSPRTSGRWPASTAPRCTSTATPAAASSWTGAR